MYKIQSTITKLAHAQGFSVGGDYALYVLGVKAKYLPRMNHLRLYGTTLDIDKMIRTIDVLYGVDIIQKDIKPFVQKIYFKLRKHEDIRVYFSNVQNTFMYTKDVIVLSTDGVEVMMPGMYTNALETIHMAKRREMSLLHHAAILPDTLVHSWDYISSQIDYVRRGWKIHSNDMWRVYVGTDQETECAICQDSLEDDIRVKTVCGHVFHLECLKQWVTSGSGWKCPMCRSSRLLLYKNCVP